MGCHALFQGIFLTQGLSPYLLKTPALASGFFTTSATWEAQTLLLYNSIFKSNYHYCLSPFLLFIAKLLEVRHTHLLIPTYSSPYWGLVAGAGGGGDSISIYFTDITNSTPKLNLPPWSHPPLPNSSSSPFRAQPSARLGKVET